MAFPRQLCETGSFHGLVFALWHPPPASPGAGAHLGCALRMGPVPRAAPGGTGVSSKGPRAVLRWVGGAAAGRDGWDEGLGKAGRQLGWAEVGGDASALPKRWQVMARGIQAAG